MRGALLALATIAIAGSAALAEPRPSRRSIAMAQLDPSERKDRQADEESIDRVGPGAASRTTLTLTPSFGAGYSSNAHDTRHDRVASPYLLPSVFAFLRKPLDADNRTGVAVGAYVDQQFFTRRAARGAGYTLLRTLVQYDFDLAGWQVALRYAPSLSLEGDTNRKDYAAQDLRLSVGRAFAVAGAGGEQGTRLRLEPQFSVLRRFADRDDESKSLASVGLEIEYRLDESWAAAASTSVEGAVFDRVDGFVRRDAVLRFQPRLVFAPAQANYALSLGVGLGRRFSNDPEKRSFQLDLGTGAEARASFAFRF